MLVNNSKLSNFNPYSTSVVGFLMDDSTHKTQNNYHARVQKDFCEGIAEKNCSDIAQKSYRIIKNNTKKQERGRMQLNQESWVENGV